ncbi:MAG: CheR family methyltransferase [Cyclobacteriaceae bacterium]
MVQNIVENIVPIRQRMTDNEFLRISEFITSGYGIKLPPFKKTMVEGRLHKRLRKTGINTFSEYIDFVFGKNGGAELLEMIDAISTNKTDFFRESAHFDFLTSKLIPELIEKNQRKVNIWSSAASSGEEIYTIAMVFEEFAATPGNLRVDYSIIGTDISVDKLKAAISGIYTYERIKDIPVNIRDRYFLKSKNKEKKEVRIIPSIRSKVKFQRQNLMDSHYGVGDNFDIIFCRNVLIYFDKELQEKVINKLCQKLAPGGYFFLGHSESIIGKEVPLTQVMPTVYRKK